MKKFMAVLLLLAMTVAFTACSSTDTDTDTPDEIAIEPQIAQMKSICELSVMECYYHNVAKFFEENAEGILWWKKDKHFWIEYSGVVRVGIDASLVNISINDSQITITLPEAEVQSCKVDSSSLTKDSYIIDKNSAAIDAEDEIYAFSEAQLRLEETASKDTALLAEAQQRAKTLLEDYITNIGDAIQKQYTINWIYIDKNGEPTGTSSYVTTSESKEYAGQGEE